MGSAGAQMPPRLRGFAVAYSVLAAHPKTIEVGRSAHSLPQPIITAQVRRASWAGSGADGCGEGRPRQAAIERVATGKGPLTRPSVGYGRKGGPWPATNHTKRV